MDKKRTEKDRSKNKGTIFKTLIKKTKNTYKDIDAPNGDWSPKTVSFIHPNYSENDHA